MDHMQKREGKNYKRREFLQRKKKLHVVMITRERTNDTKLL